MNGIRLIGVVLRCVFILLLSVTTARAQAVSMAQINGTVKDQGGLALPGVTITVTQTDTGLIRTAVTDDTGSFVLQNLPIGPYRFEAALQGSRTSQQTGIVLQVGTNATRPVTLEAGQPQESGTRTG